MHFLPVWNNYEHVHWNKKPHRNVKKKTWKLHFFASIWTKFNITDVTFNQTKILVSQYCELENLFLRLTGFKLQSKHTLIDEHPNTLLIKYIHFLDLIVTRYKKTSNITDAVMINLYMERDYESRIVLLRLSKHLLVGGGGSVFNVTLWTPIRLCYPIKP